ncbi:MAG: enoyl-CoA hydratase/isomerase family protein [Rhodospirillaceae bacterium]|nr:enoyl-CoA hydratase/isomerase family protein [Rhodospirillaceae bacterium]
MSSQSAVYMDVDGAVATIHLNRPDKRNALSQAMWLRLMELVDAADADPAVKVIVVTGEGQAFAAGADIDEFRQTFTDPKAAEVTADITYRSQKRLHRNAKPTIAKIRGACVGGGCGVALCCDLRFADTTAKLGITPGKLGLIYTLADTSRLIDAVGPAKAKDILYTGRILDAEEAYRIGLIDRLVAPGDLDAVVAEYAAQICAASQFSARGTKQIVQMILDGAPDDTPATRQLFVDAFKGDDFKEGFAAFAEKRKPKFTA